MAPCVIDAIKGVQLVGNKSKRFFLYSSIRTCGGARGRDRRGEREEPMFNKMKAVKRFIWVAIFNSMKARTIEVQCRILVCVKGYHMMICACDAMFHCRPWPMSQYPNVVLFMTDSKMLFLLLLQLVWTWLSDRMQYLHSPLVCFKR